MQHEQPPHAPVAVLKWVDALKAHMPVQNLFQRGKAVGGVEQGGHVFGDVAGGTGLMHGHFVGHPLIVPDGEPVQVRVGCTLLENAVQILYVSFINR